MSEVYIDDVNVAECEFLGKYNVCKAYVYMPKPCGCEYNPDCHFKQLQRAKAKLEQYKIKYPIIDCYRCKHSQENKVLIAENERLKDNLSEAEAIMLTYKIERDNYKQALENIKERIKQYHLKVGGEVVGADTIFDIEKIINEVLDN